MQEMNTIMASLCELANANVRVLQHKIPCPQMPFLTKPTFKNHLKLRNKTNTYCEKYSFVYINKKELRARRLSEKGSEM